MSKQEILRRTIEPFLRPFVGNIPMADFLATEPSRSYTTPDHRLFPLFVSMEFGKAEKLVAQLEEYALSLGGHSGYPINLTLVQRLHWSYICIYNTYISLPHDLVFQEAYQRVSLPQQSRFFSKIVP